MIRDIKNFPRKLSAPQKVMDIGFQRPVVHLRIQAFLTMRGHTVFHREGIGVITMVVVGTDIHRRMSVPILGEQHTRIPNSETSVAESHRAVHTSVLRVGLPRAEHDCCRAQLPHRHKEVAFIGRMKLNSRQTVERKASQIDLSLLGIGNRHSVVDHCRVLCAKSAHAHSFQAARSAIVAQIDARKATQRISSRCDTHTSDGGCVELLHRSSRSHRGIGPNA